jgi:hypothetical protein
MAANYGYVNARVRGLRSRLLPDGFVAAQVDAGSSRPSRRRWRRRPTPATSRRRRPSTPASPPSTSALARNYLRATDTLLTAPSGARELIALLLRATTSPTSRRSRGAGMPAATRTPSWRRPARGRADAAVVRSMAEAADLGAAGQVLALARHPLAEAFRRAAAGVRRRRRPAGLRGGARPGLLPRLVRGRGAPAGARRLPRLRRGRDRRGQRADRPEAARPGRRHRPLLRRRRREPLGLHLRRHRPPAAWGALADADGSARRRSPAPPRSRRSRSARTPRSTPWRGAWRSIRSTWAW